MKQVHTERREVVRWTGTKKRREKYSGRSRMM